jgi:translation initiation factor 1A
MPNTTGGKNYKKSKHSGNSIEPPFIDRQPDQVYGRIIKNLGNRNLLVYGNDGVVRLCHIRGAMQKRIWLNIGDIVLISIRDFEKTPAESGKTYEKGDILAKYDVCHHSKLKKLPDINPRLFMQLETADGVILKELGNATEYNGIELEKSDDEKEDEEKDIVIDDI